MRAPHLPPPSCTIAWHKRLQSLPWFFFVLGTALVGGVVAALITMTWIAPQPFVVEGVKVFPSSPVLSSTTQTPVIFESRVRRQVMTLIDASAFTNDGFFLGTSKIGDAVVLTDNGWGVLYLPSYTKGQEKQWKGVDYTGTSFEIEMAVPDGFREFVFVKFARTGLEASALASVSFLPLPATVWAYHHGLWQGETIHEAEEWDRNTKLPLWQPRMRFRFFSSVPSGELLFTSDGEFLGVSNGEGYLVPARLIGAQIRSVLENGKPTFESIPLVGIVVEKIVSAGGEKRAYGFMVSAVQKKEKGGVQVGDVITKVNEAPIDPVFLDRQMMDAGGEVSLTLLRKGKEYVIVVKKVAVFGI